MAADDADNLYGLPLEQFVPERDALAKRLRAEKRRADADEIKALRKPSVAAWADNQAVRSQPKAARRARSPRRCARSRMRRVRCGTPATRSSPRRRICSPAAATPPGCAPPPR